MPTKEKKLPTVSVLFLYAAANIAYINSGILVNKNLFGAKTGNYFFKTVRFLVI